MSVATIDRTESFGAVLRELRLRAGLSQEGLADKAGLSARGLSDLERGARRAPHPSTLSRLAEALELDPEMRRALVAAARPKSDRSVRPQPATSAGEDMA